MDASYDLNFFIYVYECFPGYIYKNCCGMVFLHTVNMCCSRCLVNKATLAYGKAGKSQVENPNRGTREGQNLRGVNKLPRKQYF